MACRVLARPSTVAPVGPVRQGEPLTFGVPLPRGLAAEHETWGLRAADGSVFVVQSRSIEAWPDGTVRWLLVDVQPDITPGVINEFSLEHRAATQPSATAPLSVSESTGVIIVDTGTARFTMGAGESFSFRSVEAGGGAGIGEAGFTITDRSGRLHRAVIDRAETVESGPLRCVVSLAGHVHAGPSGRPLLVTADLHFFSGLATVRLLVTLTNPNRARHRGGFWDLGDEGSALIEDASITIARAASDTHGVVRASIEPGAPLTQVATPFEVYQDSSGGENWQSTVHLNRDHRIPTSFRGYRIRAGAETTSGLRATPVVAVESGTTLLAATLPHFWQNFPKAIESDGESLVIRLFPAQYADLHELQGGEQRTHELYLAFGPDRLSAHGLEWCRSRTIAGVEPAWCLSSEAVPFLAPLDAGHAELVESAIEGADRFEHKREVIDEYGWRHFGDIYGDHEAVPHDKPTPLVSHYNNQYDPIAGFACQWLRTGDPRWWIAMSELASHVIDIDVYHTAEDKAAYNHGLFWHTYHYGDADTATHRSYPRSGLDHVHGGGPSAGHNYTSGLALHYFLTGERASWSTVRDLAQYVIDIDDGRKSVFRWLDRGATGLAALSVDEYYGPGRGPANSLNALTDGYRLTGDRRFARKAEELIRRVIHPQDDISQRRLDAPELRWFYTMFLQALGRWLREKVERGELDEIYAYGRESLLHYARWMAVHEYPYLDKPEKLEFPTETWAAQDIRKSDVFLLAALHTSCEERQRFIDRGRFFHQHSIQALEGKPTRTLARPVVVLLTSGNVGAWVEARPDAAEPDPPRIASFGVPQVFVPQRARAIRRFLWLSAAAGFALAAAALYALR